MLLLRCIASWIVGLQQGSHDNKAIGASIIIHTFSKLTTRIICYYTFWSGVADLSARYPRARADKPQHRDKKNYYGLLGGSA